MTILRTSIEVSLMGCTGYLFGKIMKTNPKVSALTWIIAEIGVQIMKNYIKIEFAASLAGAISANRLKRYKMIDSTFKALVISACAFTVISTFMHAFVERIIDVIKKEQIRNKEIFLIT